MLACLLRRVGYEVDLCRLHALMKPMGWGALYESRVSRAVPGGRDGAIQLD